MAYEICLMTLHMCQLEIQNGRQLIKFVFFLCLIGLTKVKKAHWVFNLFGQSFDFLQEHVWFLISRRWQIVPYIHNECYKLKYVRHFAYLRENLGHLLYNSIIFDLRSRKILKFKKLAQFLTNLEIFCFVLLLWWYSWKIDVGKLDHYILKFHTGKNLKCPYTFLCKRNMAVCLGFHSSKLLL